jgi:hypothetical protein
VGGEDESNACTRVSRIGRGDHILIVEYSLNDTAQANYYDVDYSRMLTSGGFTAGLVPVNGE